MYKGEIVTKIESVIKHFERKVVESHLPIPRKVEVFLALKNPKDSEDAWFYYCVDPIQRCLFWLDKVDVNWMADKVDSVPDPAYLSTLSLY